MIDHYFHCGRFVAAFSLLLLLWTGLANAQEDLPNLISLENDGQLISCAGNLPAWPDEGWDGVNDGDVETWNGTVTVFNQPEEGDDHPWAIFAFKDEAAQSINAVEFFMISKAARDENLQSRCGQEFQLLVSTTGTDEANFTVVLEDIIEMDINVLFEDQEWVEFTFGTTRAKYVKLIFLTNYGDGTYTSVAEVSIHGSMSVSHLDKTAATWGEIKND